MSKVKAFLSHKAKDAALAKKVGEALSSVFPDLEIFLSEEIPKSDDFRRKIWDALDKAKFFILLYTDPSDDWSWCFFEVGAYRSIWRDQSRNLHPIYCLHPKESPPPSPLSNLQTIRAELVDINRWLEDMRRLLVRKAPASKKAQLAAEQIESAVNGRAILEERTIKPYVWVAPQWPLASPANFHAAKLPDIPLEKALVTIDPESATKLGFSTVPDGLELMDFLRKLDCDAEDFGPARPYWVTRFFGSLTKAIKGDLLLQEVAYFRHESGGILRPIVASVSKSRDGAQCRLKVLFIQAFGAPLADHPSAVQRLADGVRLGVRTRMEVINGFSGQMPRMFRQKGSEADINVIARNYPIGRRVIEAIETIAEEARAHGFRPEDPAPILFARDPEQSAYEQIRNRSIGIWQQLKTVAEREDADGTGKYAETERLLAALKTANDQYLRLALPRLNELLSADTGSGRQGGSARTARRPIMADTVASLAPDRVLEP